MTLLLMGSDHFQTMCKVEHLAPGLLFGVARKIVRHEQYHVKMAPLEGSTRPMAFDKVPHTFVAVCDHNLWLRKLPEELPQVPYRSSGANCQKIRPPQSPR